MAIHSPDGDHEGSYRVKKPLLPLRRRTIAKSDHQTAAQEHPVSHRPILSNPDLEHH
jgi:hypothetical protein